MSMAATNAQWAATLVHNLVAAGITQVVVSPGSRNTPLVLAFDQCSGLSPNGLNIQVVLDERAAAFVALGMSRVSGTPAVLVCTSGSACAHYLPALVEARYSRIPLLVLSADRPIELHHCGAPQTIQQEQIFGDHVLRSYELNAPVALEPAPKLWADIAAGAVNTAMGSPKGPVHINVPFREPLWDPQVHRSPQIAHSACLEPSLATTDPELAKSFAAKLAEFEKGVIVCGPNSGVQDRSVAPAVVQLAQQLRWPILADPVSGLRFGRHALSAVIAHYDAFLRCDNAATRLRPDCIVQIGQSPTSKSLNQWIESCGAEHMVLVDPDGQWHNPSRTAHQLLTAPPAALCVDSAEALGGLSRNGEWLSLWQLAETQSRGAASTLMEAPLWEGQVAYTLSHALPEGCALHVAGSMPIRDLDTFGGCQNRDIAVYANRGANGIDGTLATAAGESLQQHKPLCVLLGDLAFIHDISGLLTASQLGAQLTIVVVDNGGGAIFENLAISQHPTTFERYFLTPQKADIERLASACGARVSRAATHRELRAAVQADLERSGLGVVLVSVDREYNRQQHQNAWTEVQRAMDQGGLQ